MGAKIESKIVVRTAEGTKVFAVLSSAAKAVKGYGNYRRVALVELESYESAPVMIAEHARGIVRVIRTWERVAGGLTERCAYRRAVASAIAAAESMCVA